MSRRIEAFGAHGTANGINFSPGAAASYTAAFTLLFLWKPNAAQAGTLWNAGHNVPGSSVALANDYSDGKVYWTSGGAFTDDGALGGAYSASTGWELWAMSKAAGTVTPRFHRYRYDTTTWSHGNGGGNVQDFATTIDAMYVGTRPGSSETGDFWVAAVGGVNANLSDSDIQTGGYIASILPWKNNLGFAWKFDLAVATAVVDLTGNGADQFALIGTTTLDAGEDPPGFSYSLSGGQTQAINPAIETDSAIALGRLKARVLGLVGETDAAVSLGRQKSRALGLALESDTAISLGRLKTRALGVAGQAEVAMPLGRVKRRALGVATETDTAVALGGAVPPRCIVVRPYTGIVVRP